MRSCKIHLTQALLALMCLAPGCSTEETGPSSDSSDTGPVVRVIEPVGRKVTDYAFYTGRIDAPESVKIQARVTGYLDIVGFEPGAEVKKGQRLFLIDPRPYKAALDVAASQVALSEARLKLAKADYARAVEIAKTPGAISRQDVDKYAAAQDEAAASVAAAEANLEAARLNVEFTEIASPIDGVVGRNLLTVGNLVTQDHSLLTTVVSQDPMYAYFDIDESTVMRVKRMIEKAEADRKDRDEDFAVELGLIDEAESYPHKGRLDFINNAVDPNTGTLQVRGVFANPPLKQKFVRLLTPGMFVRIRLPLSDPHDAVLVPEEAVGTDQGKKYLKVVNDEDVVEYRPVELGARQPNGLQVVIPVKMVRTKDGLRRADESTPPDAQTVDSIRLGERVVVGGLQFVHPGMCVQPRPAGAADDGKR